MTQNQTNETETKTPFCNPIELPNGQDFQFGNGEVLTVDFARLTPEMMLRLARHGLIQKVRDSYSGAKGDFEYAVGSANKVIDNILADKWVAHRASATASKIAELCQAIANLKGVELDTVTAAVTQATPEQITAWKKNPRIKAEIAAIRAAAAKAAAEASEDDFEL